MKKQSFSSTVKEHLIAANIKKKCCKRAFDDGCKISSADDTAAFIDKAAKGLVCGECLAHFIAGAFISCGNISDPNKSYHMEFSFTDEAAASIMVGVLSDAGFEPGTSIRKGKHILYYKNSNTIEDLLGYMGASFGAFELINAKIVREIRENTNRQVNCDSANIVKTIKAAEGHIQIINELIESGQIKALSDDLKETAELRLANPNASLAELGQLFVSPISKSGVKHRLDKIVDYYNTLKQNSTESETNKE